ncbi:hypothetical protein [Xanthomonas sp. SHU 166]|nr:hypothetical protein [Xanthomonas sp. SHU 166]
MAHLARPPGIADRVGCVRCRFLNLAHSAMMPHDRNRSSRCGQ